MPIYFLLLALELNKLSFGWYFNVIVPMGYEKINLYSREIFSSAFKTDKYYNTSIRKKNYLKR